MILYTIANLWITTRYLLAIVHTAFIWPESVLMLIAYSLFVPIT